jgi:2-amino-4-hydroxy-6-hydroxymethyldihydropteridine diphosphokinase
VTSRSEAQIPTRRDNQFNPAAAEADPDSAGHQVESRCGGSSPRSGGTSRLERVFIALGSNLGDRAGWLRQAREKLSELSAVELLRASAVYETAPVGKTDQPAFLNQVIEIRTTLAPEALLAQLLHIEAELGRVRNERWGPRLIDLDLLAFGNRQARTRRLALPHPELQRRRFVLEPWAEIAPEFEVSGLKATVNELLRRCPDESRVEKLKI